MTDPEYRDPRGLQLKVRPFEKLVGDSGGLIPLRCCGRIEGSTFVLDIGASSYRLPTAAIDSDSQGEFAMLQQCEQAIAAGFVLKVEFALDEFAPGEVGCDISVSKPEMDKATADAMLRAQGIDPGSVNLLIRNVAGVSFGFIPSGQMTSWGGAGTPHDSGSVQ